MKNYFFIFLLLILCAGTLQAQYLPIFSQYVSNGLVINPAYAGSREVLSTSIIYRNQWVGFKGAPIYQTMSAHAPLRNNNVGLGILFLNESTGPIRNSNVYFNYAYRIKVGKGKLALGIKAGMNYSSFNWGRVYTNKEDPAFSENSDFYILPNFGAGLYYYAPKWFFGASIPYLLSVRGQAGGNGYEIFNDVKNYNFLITSGVLIDIDRNFKLKPTALFKYNQRFKEQVDMNMNVILLNNQLWIGGAYRVNEAYSGSFELQLNPQFRLGYSFDYSSAALSHFRYNSHEINLRYEFTYKIKASNPRYF